MMSGVISMMPMVVFLIWPEEVEYAVGYLVPSCVLISIGFVSWIAFRPKKPVVLTSMDGGMIVLFSWIVVIFLSALPFRLILNLGWTQSIFESVSGWTTTGLSVVDVTSAPRSILLWRSIIQLAGGAGLAILMLAAITGPVGTGLSSAEGRSDQLVPNVKRSAKLVVSIYIGYALFGVMAYVISGMSVFDAVNHAFAAISTGGFSTRVESIGHWDSFQVEEITIVLMILGNLNFLTAYLFLKGKVRFALKSGELHVMAVLIPVAFGMLYCLVCRQLYPMMGKGMRVAVFESVSALTTTGFSTVNYTNWNAIGFLVLILLMIIGGGAFSTAGGIKQVRVYLMIRSFLWGIKRSFLPRTAVADYSVWVGDRKEAVSDTQIRRISDFTVLYFIIYFLGVGILAAHGCGLRESLFEFASSLSTVGLSIGVTQASSPSLILWAEIFGMFLGRLEFFVIIISLWKLMRDAFETFHR
ncbi:MAG: TrkH family potassium uptake protein [bacterium]